MLSQILQVSGVLESLNFVSPRFDLIARFAEVLNGSL